MQPSRPGSADGLAPGPTAVAEGLLLQAMGDAAFDARGRHALAAVHWGAEA